MSRALPLLASAAVAALVIGSERKDPVKKPSQPGPGDTGSDGGEPLTDIDGNPYTVPAEGPPIEDWNMVTEACDPTEKPGVVAFRSFVLEHFGGDDGGITRQCHIGGPSEHKEGRAWDWSIHSHADALDFLDWLTRNDGEQARRAGIFYVIYDRMAYKPDGLQWRPYHGSNPHTDHVHLSFSHAGAAGASSFYG